MATYRKDIVASFGSLDEFAQQNGIYKIYESDLGYHTVQVPGDEDAILSSTHLTNLRLVWPEIEPDLG
jgi:hypothetical protein